MKILIIHNSYRHHGGEDTCVQNQIALLQKYGHQVKLFTLSNKNINTRSFSQQLNIALRMFHHPTLDRQLAPLINSFKPDLAHLHNIYPLITPSVYHLLKKHHLPIVQTIHNYRFMFPKPILFRRGPLCPYCLSSNLIQPAIFHRCYNQSLPYTIAFSLSYLAHKHISKSYQLVDAFVFPSKFTQNFYTEYARLPSKKTIHIPNFTFPPTQKSPGNKDHFTYLGRLFPEKGIKLLLKAIIPLTHLKFLIVGQGPLENLVKSVANRYPHITYHPFVSPAKIHTIYSQSLFTILPSTWYEVQPMAIIESFAHHTPVITPAIGPLTQMVTPSKNGFLYHPNTPEKLRKTILLAASLSKQKYDLLSQNSHHTYQTNYTPSIHYRSLISLYRKLVDTGSSPSPKYTS